jgi:hypothetical protein
MRCKLCNRTFKKSHNWTEYCPACRRLINRGAKVCANRTCRNILLVHSPYKHGKKEFCSLQCMRVYYSHYLKYCVKCGLPLINHNKGWDHYITKNKHQDCEMAQIYFEEFEFNKDRMIQYNREGVYEK